jgi:hypothetical protein
MRYTEFSPVAGAEGAEAGVPFSGLLRAVFADLPSGAAGFGPDDTFVAAGLLRDAVEASSELLEALLPTRFFVALVPT